MTLTEQTHKEILSRLRRIEGQARGIQRMVVEDRDCLEILNQLASLRSAAYSTSVVLAQQYAVQCMQGNGEHESTDEAMRGLVDVLLRVPH